MELPLPPQVDVDSPALCVHLPFRVPVGIEDGINDELTRVAELLAGLAAEDRVPIPPYVVMGQFGYFSRNVST